MDSHVKTFVSYNGRGSSQIDYILGTTPGILKSFVVEEKHILVSALLDFKHSEMERIQCNNRPFTNLNWDKLDKNKFEQIFHWKG